MITGDRGEPLSPDGRKLVYSSLGTGILITDLATTKTTPLHGTMDGDQASVWSPDGRQMVYHRPERLEFAPVDPRRAAKDAARLAGGWKPALQRDRTGKRIHLMGIAEG
ncbi:MAG: hypothetical protein EHM70_26555 [Chloroflexota bacterium]|nr:MAG: hypothetical protein EHM70_26555 [Chloroflexota bacterium]